MKLQAIELRNFLSHERTDFQLNGARLATLQGPNGSGKSALLDAVLFCLYDAARGRTDDLVKLGATDMSAAVTFDFAGGTYRVTRGRTTKARGSSFLELAIANFPDGGAVPEWRPLTRDTIRETQDAIAELLGLDAQTFTTAVFLQQGASDAFAQATAGDRKKLLSQVLGLQLFEHAEVRAREEARDVEGRTAADRATMGRLEAELAGRDNLTSTLDVALARDLDLARQEAEVRVELEKARAQEREAAALCAAAQAAETRVATAGRALEDVAARYRVAMGRKADLESQLAVAKRQAADLPPAPVVPIDYGVVIESEITRLEAAAREDRDLERAIATNAAAVEQQQSAAARILDAWTYRRDAAQRRIDELVADLRSLPPITCPKCRNSWTEDQAGLGEKLRIARNELAELGDPPKEPMHLAIEAAKVERLRINRRELAFDEQALNDARARLRAADAARDAKTRADGLTSLIVQHVAALAATATDLLTIGEAGKAARAESDAAKAQLATMADGHGLAATAAQAAREAETSLGAIGGLRRSAAGEISSARAGLERLDRLAAERDELAAGLAVADRQLARLRRLVAAFGVKGIPARIIESVLPELAGNANDLLAQLRPGMTLDIRAQRAKADGKGVVEALDLIVADEAGERSLGLYSGGERMSVSLALAVGLSRLVARRAGTAIRTLVIDEPDGLDADARRSFGQALRLLAHHGELERVVLVSHHPDLAEFGDAVFEVTKGPAGSVVTAA